MMNTKTIIYWILRLIVAIILIQTLYFKFTAHPDSVYIFSTLGVEPWGRIGLGITELFTAILVLYPKTSFWGMLNSLGIIIGAIYAHVFFLGINVLNDEGLLFSLAMIVFIASSTYLLIALKERYNLKKAKNEK